MKKRALMALSVIPMAMLLVVPITAYAQSNTITLTVECASASSQFAFADLTFLGHYVFVVCPANGGEHSAMVTFSTTISRGVFVAKLLAGNVYQTDYANIYSSDCPINGIYGPTPGPYGGHGSYAVWEIDSSGCG